MAAPIPQAFSDEMLEEAIAWCVRLREDRGEEAAMAFDAWLSGAPARPAAWEVANRLWDLAGVALVTEPAVRPPQPDDRARGEDR